MSVAVGPGHVKRSRAVLWFCAAFMAVQVLVPLSLLPDPSNKPFGWQMYSAVTGHHFEVILPDGSAHPIDPRNYVVRYRSEIDYRGELPEILCDRIPYATEVVASNVLAGSEQRYPCRP